RLKLFPGRTFRLLTYQPERLPALFPFECSISLQNIRTINAIPTPRLFNHTAPLESPSWHRHPRAHRRRRYRWKANTVSRRGRPTIGRFSMGLNHKLAVITVLRASDYDSFGCLSRIQPI